MFKSVFAAAIALAAFPAFAQDVPETFNGPFVGIQGGWQQDRQTLDVGNSAAQASNSNDGLTYGGQLGYDLRLSPTVVLGGEVALTGRTGTGTLSDGINTYELRQGRTVAATARLGYLGTPNDLFYVRGGYANANYKIDTAFGGDVSADRDGYTIGAGYERMLARNVSARVEYAYSDFGSDKSFGIAGPNAVAELKYRRHAVTAGVNFRF